MDSAHLKDKEESPAQHVPFDEFQTLRCAPASLLHDSYLAARRIPQTSICLNDFSSMEAGMK